MRNLQIKVADYERLIKQAQEPEVKAAYSTIQSVHVSTLSGLEGKMLCTISTLMAATPPKTDS